MISTKLSVGVTKKGKFGRMLPPLPLDQIEIVMSSQRSNRSASTGNDISGQYEQHYSLLSRLLFS